MGKKKKKAIKGDVLMQSFNLENGENEKRHFFSLKPYVNS